MNYLVQTSLRDLLIQNKTSQVTGKWDVLLWSLHVQGKDPELYLCTVP